METEQDYGTNMENPPEDKKTLVKSAKEMEDKPEYEMASLKSTNENAYKGEGGNSTVITPNEGVNPGDIKDAKTAEKEIDKTSEDKASPAIANESDNPGNNKDPVTADKRIESMPKGNMSPSTAANTLDDPGDIKNSNTANKEIDKTSGDKAPLATANESDKTSDNKVPPHTANERDDPGDIKDPNTANKKIDKTSGEKAPLATANESDKTSDNKVPPHTANESDKTSGEKASPATENEVNSTCEDKASPATAKERDDPRDSKDPNTANKEIDKASEYKAPLATANESDKTSDNKVPPHTANESNSTCEDNATPATAKEREGMSEENISPGSAAKNVADKGEEEKSLEITQTEGLEACSADKGEEGKSTVKTPNQCWDTSGEGKHTKETSSQDDGNMIKRKQSKDSKNRGRLKEAERRLEDAEKNIIALTQSLDSANLQIEEAVKSRDEAEERLMDKVKEHAKQCNENWNIEKENLLLRETIKEKSKEQKAEIDRLKTETNEQSKSIDMLQKTINKLTQKAEQMKKQHQDKLESLSRERKTHEKHKQFLVDENKRLKWFENIYTSLQHEHQQLNSNLQIAERKHNRDKETIQSLSKQNESLHEEKQELLLRLSKIAGANLTLNNPNIADLSDDKRPTKLAEEFSELYDNEWTDAFEVIEIKEERDKTTYMLLLLQRASDICREISDTHIHDIKKGLCHMTFRTKSISAEEVTTSITEPTANECQEGKNNEQSQSDDDFIMINIVKTNENPEQDSDELKTQQIVHTGASNENSGSKYTLNNEGSPETPGENDDEEILDDTKASLEDKMNFDSKQEDIQTNLAKEYETCESLSDINMENPAEKQNTNTNNIKDELTQGNEQNEETPADQDALQPTVTAAHFVEPMQNNAQAPLAGTATQMDTEKEQTQSQPLVTCLTDEDTKQANKDLSEMSPHGGSKGEPHVQEAQKDSNGHLSSDVGSKAGQNVNQSVSRVTREDGSRVQSNPNEPSEVEYSENGNAQIPPKFTDVTDTSTQTDSEKNPTQLHQSVLNKQAHTDASIDITTHDRFKAEHTVNQSVSGESEENDNGDDKQTDQNPKVEYSELVNEIKFDFDSLRNDQKKTVMELRKFIEINVSHQIEKGVANAIAAENKIDNVKDEMIVKYIKKCVNVCWSMCRHEPPVHIEFPDIQVDQKFDSNVFKPYTKSGKHLHYVVWPALFLHKDGPMLSKGVAQGR